MTGADLLGHIVERACDRFIGCFQFAGGVQAEKRRAFLDCELIERQMFGGLRDRELQLIGPHLGRLAGPGIDQVERIALEGTARDCNRLERLVRGVQPPQHFQ
jgi:hypothetical protein